MKSHFIPVATGKKTIRSHFVSGAAVACAVTGATTLLSGTASAQNFIAADSAANPIYTPSWSAGQNGGYGFGPWSFDSTADGAGQEMSSAAAVGTAWTLFTETTGHGISDVGRSITEPGGLQPGQTFEAVLQNPSSYHYYGGFDILFLNSTDNLPGGYNTAALRLQGFDAGYYNPGADWSIVDYDVVRYNSYSYDILPLAATAAAGVKLDLTLTSTNTYSVTLTPLSNPSEAYSQTGMLATTDGSGNAVTNLPINYVNFRLYNGIASKGPNDTNDNYEITSMTIQGLPLNIQMAGTNAVLSWLDIPGYYLESATSLAPSANWTSNSTSPVTVNSDNFVTNPVAGHQQFFRLQLQQ
jgi:hypothetical protein